jgi:hypothetical protein
MKVKKIVETCSACPAQWEGSLDDGRAIYIRYRFGYLSIRVSPDPTDDIMKAVETEEVFGTDYGGVWDGCMDLATVSKLSKSLFDWSQVVYY